MITTALVASVAGVAGLGCTGKYVRPTTREKVHPTPERVERGNYIVNNVAACGACHTPRTGFSWLEGERPDAFLSGGQYIDDVGREIKIQIPNITQDPGSGIGRWTDDQIMRAIRDGVRANDDLLYPPMPFMSLGRMADEDVRSVVAYLRTVTPLRNQTGRDDNQIPFGLKMALRIGTFHHLPVGGVRSPGSGDRVKYGEYLATAIAPCWSCHSLEGRAPSNDNLFGGSTTPFDERGVGKVYARNLTPDPETGIGKYTPEQIKESLKNGKRLDGKPMAPPMSSFIPHFAGMADQDLDAIVAYLKSIPPRKQKIPERVLTAEASKAIGETR
jgi:mono/diheme cytochrome c family protein